MIISPPFLPAEGQSANGQASVDTTMVGGEPGNGAFPVSLELAWHGGMHIKAPPEGAGAASVRAVADGVVFYVRAPTSKPSQPSKDDPLNYYTGWTSDGVVVLKHDTEIGEGDNASPAYYSVYMHLSELGEASDPQDVAHRKLKVGDRSWRKDKIGQAGLIYGAADLVHIEIVFDDANLQKLIGRSPDAVLDTSKDGRTDSVWGEVYVVLPTNSGVQTQDMRTLQRQAYALPKQADAAEAKATEAEAKAQQAPTNTHLQQQAHQARSHATTLRQQSTQKLSDYANLRTTPSSRTTEELIAGLRYHQGGCTITTYQKDGTEVGTALEEADGYEYSLYTEATALYPNSPSAGYELLRFGRVIGPDALSADDTAHWRQINIPGGQGWVDLNVAGTAKFSDADFPPWKLWNFADDDTDGNSRCDSAALKKLILEDGDACYDESTAPARLHLAAVQRKLQHSICKIPSEWDSDKIDQRWGWLKQDNATDYTSLLNGCMSDESFNKLKAHITKLAFWKEAGLPELAWRIHPREFVRVMQMCGWLSRNEIIQLFPKTAMRKSHQQWVSEGVTPNTQNINQYRIGLNKAARRYGVVTPLRMAAFYANAMQETQWFSRVEEGGASSARYSPWTGRGFMQLTWPDNYIKYWRFTGKEVQEDIAQRLHHAAQQANSQNSNAPLADAAVQLPLEMAGWRTAIASDAAQASDSAGAYWAWSLAASSADMNEPNVRDTKIANGSPEPYYTNAGFGQVAATVNTGHASTSYNSVNGIVARFQAFTTAQMVLFDNPIFPDASGSPTSTPEGYKPRRP